MITWHRLVATACFLSLLSLVVLLTGCAAVQSAPTKPIGTSTPSRDPATQAYLSVLQQYYVPFSVAAQQEITTCSDPFLSTTNQQALQNLLASCQPVEQALIPSAQAVLDHLRTVAPPSRWQTADSELKQALQITIKFLTAKLHAIDDQSVAEYLAAENNAGVPAGRLFCDPVAQFNAGPPPLFPPLLPPVVSLCPATGV